MDVSPAAVKLFPPVTEGEGNSILIFVQARKKYSSRGTLQSPRV
jgi:hypothetical protein